MPQLGHGEEEAAPGVIRALRLAVEISLVVLAIEAVGAFLSHSLSLTVDAFHNIPDLIAFAVSWGALRGTRAGSTHEFTFGTHRGEVFAGLLNGGLVLGTGAIFGYTALGALLQHASFAGAVDPVWLLVAAVPTLVLRAVNLRALGRLPKRSRDLNLASVVVHIASDLAITGALLFAGSVLFLDPALGFADSLAALAIAAVLVFESVPILREGWGVLSERIPRGLSLRAITEAGLSVPGVEELHDVHVWSVCSTLVCMTAHVRVREMSLRESTAILTELRRRMAEEFGISHATFEVEGPSGGSESAGAAAAPAPL